ncbi:MAG: 2-C-methyl-D-erythritol 2,4-cyclodiphosphate synthase [Candidatus Omnitrophica bacterium]|nr:2-C-methyl-D-erythritol 2,4-cyclodiphosphate synthase [Candidatus Omnitrophota bacterium]
MRVGIGYDIHKLMKGRKLILGGVELPYDKGLEGHSDADVLLHSICDAMLGASSSGDIGRHFPNTDPKYKDISSMKLLKQVFETIGRKGFVVNNIDAVIITEEPKIAPFAEKMKKNLASMLEIDIERVNIKATTNEGFGAIGSGEAIASYSVVTLQETRDER